MLSKITNILNLELGGEVWIGQIGETADADKADAMVFKIQGYFGINPANPLQNYAYFKQTGVNMTVENFCKAFDIALPITTPKAIKESGFYGDQVLSYTANPDGKLLFFI